MLPALSYYSASLRAAFGVQTRTRDGRGYGLTFDDGPHPEGTAAVMEVLARFNTPATFFLVGEQVARAPALAAEIVAAGHGIGLHCDRHRNLLRLGPRAVAQDIARARARIEDATGCAVERYRPPYGIFNAAALQIARREGWRPLLWTHWGRDWRARAHARVDRDDTARARRPQTGRCCCCTTRTTTRRPGSWRKTVAALPRVLEALGESGLAGTLAV